MFANPVSQRENTAFIYFQRNKHQINSHCESITITKKKGFFKFLNPAKNKCDAKRDI